MLSDDELLEYFFGKGGHISPVYMQDLDRKSPHSPAVVSLLGRFYVDDTTREAILSALKKNHIIN